jgi:hypothetical protein
LERYEYLLNSNNSEPSQSRMKIFLIDKPEDVEEQIKWESESTSIKKK